jgi:4-alpha-glucanotransferase
MPADPKTEFYHPADYPYLTVCTPSVHDVSTLRGWWQEDRSATQRFWSHILGEPGAAPYFCDEHVTTKVINQHIYSPSMWAVFMMQVPTSNFTSNLLYM